jgi:hypothetical protein
MIDLSHASFIGPEIPDLRKAAILPLDLRNVLLAANGFILFGGGLHVRGICDAPDWHSLDQAWTGEDALCVLFPSVQCDDVPFAEDFLGDQFLLRDGLVLRLFAETGELEEMGIGLNAFLGSVSEDPHRFLPLNLLTQFHNEGEALHPGMLLNVYPPLCIKEASAGVSMRAIPAMERIRFLADFARQIAVVPDGAKLRINVT